MLFLYNIDKISNYFNEIKKPLTISIENGFDNLYLYIRDNISNEPLLTISFKNGSFRDTYNEEKDIVKFWKCNFFYEHILV